MSAAIIEMKLCGECGKVKQVNRFKSPNSPRCVGCVQRACKDRKRMGRISHAEEVLAKSVQDLSDEEQNQEKKFCGTCGQMLPISRFKSHASRRCRKCYSFRTPEQKKLVKRAAAARLNMDPARRAKKLAGMLENYYQKRQSILWRVTTIVKRAKSKGIPYDEQAISLVYTEARARGTCEVTGLPFAPPDVCGLPARWDILTIDKIEPNKGYVAGNMRAVLWAVNCGISHWGLECFLKVAKAALKHNQERITP